MTTMVCSHNSKYQKGCITQHHIACVNVILSDIYRDCPRGVPRGDQNVQKMC